MGTEVAVVGAGFSGLAAALALARAGVRTRVLEARDRVGGRVLTRWLADGTQLDLGAQWVGPTQDRVNGLLARYGIATFPSAAHGASPVIFPDGRHAGAPEAAARVLDLLDAYAERVDPVAPWAGAEAAEWDRTTLAGWLRTAAPDPATARYLGRLLAGGLLAAGPDEISVLQLAFYLRSGGGSRALLAMAGGAQQDRIVGGPPVLAEALAAALGPDAVRLSTPVRAIAQDRTGVVVHTDTDRVEADAVVVAVPPTLAGRIRYDPPLPPLRDALTQRMPMGSAIKVHAVYPEPFWRADGRSGVAFCLAGPVTETVDNSIPASPRGVLTAFSYGPEANALRRMPPQARQASLLDALAAVVGPAARRPEEFVEYDWSADEWTRGCFCGAPTLGSWCGYGPELRQPVGRVHWAGTETATRWAGYLDGAIEAGERAAAEILARTGG
ncbi:FAD-dependent oxidoreductase [Micromonospora sp. DSM 115977]|uniref:FAD-dependent oxidoreductase n=1 Tax=Micromonospora reichwaldensis TaxID=3075516 RepID=A0ABU2X2C7_9ACTN|nr:FAD-dependent oxidoreductase [Micromonospora sp. DSM 115977]MDT0532350.1 FAD-dependent oxidoreductase [Micromonospora sp. DSM 115977]